MSDCCSANQNEAAIDKKASSIKCSDCQQKGKSIELVTIKCQLTSEALKDLDASASYYFCRSPECPVVYFSESVQYTQAQVRVPVFQKDHSPHVHACYCFDYTREKLTQEVQATGDSTAATIIAQYVKDKKCACEFRNPQGSCCLGNVNKVIKEAKEASLALKV